MENEDIKNVLNQLELPEPEKLIHQKEFKIPLLSYKKSSRAGLWLLTIPLLFFITDFLKNELGLFSPILNGIMRIFKSVGDNGILTFLIPVIFLLLPLLAMILNLLSFCYFNYQKATKELLITVKYRPVNIAIFIISLAMLLFVFMPDSMP